MNQMKNTIMRMSYWTAAWVITMALATFGPIFIWTTLNFLTFLAILINGMVGIGMILTFRRYLNNVDELQKKIQLESLSISLGVGIVGGLSYSQLDIANLISQDAEIGFLVIGMSITYILGIVVGQLRYQ